MADVSLVIGESGTGKSTSLRNLDPKETFIINVLNKTLPFKGYSKKYHKLSSDGSTGNYYSSDNSDNIMRVINLIDKKREEIKNIVIDDWQYLLCNEFMKRATEKGYGKFSEIGQHGWQVINRLLECRDDIFGFVLSHSDISENGKVGCKTIGKILQDKVTIEGMFTSVFHSLVIDENFMFLTQNDGIHIAKSPMELFNDKYIPNDLSLIINQFNKYKEAEKHIGE